MELILTHSYADFDALASQLAAALLFPQAIPVLSGQLNTNVREFEALHHEELPFVRAADLPAEPITRLFLVDTSNQPRLAIIGDAPIPTTIIDHHPPGRPLLPHEELISAETGATTTILVQRLIESDLPVSPAQATLLLLGIYEDTGGLVLSGTCEADVACAAWLLSRRARIEAVSEFLHRPMTSDQERLFRQIESALRMEEIVGWTVLLVAIRVEGAVPELSPLAHRLRDLYAPAVMVLAAGTGDSGTQLIIRSNSDALDAGELAARFGGGGHSNASAAYVRGRPAPEVLADVETAIRQMLRPAATAANIMTTRVHSIPADTTIEQAEELMVRYGHGALPVLDSDGLVCGLISRRDLDRARRHGLRDAVVARYMWHGPALVPPATPLVAVRHALAADNGERTGRLLVVDDQKRLLGIITRSDLLRAWAGGHDTEINGHAMIAQALEQFLDPELLQLLRHVAAVAEELGTALYVVGGTVRDLLLSRLQDDLDLVVEGDGIVLAQALAGELNGYVRSHTQFGTATLILPPGWNTALHPNHISAPIAPELTLDLVTARSEFYEHPSALPQVEAASLRHDLHRRDFTINTLAVCLNPSRYGRLYDFYGGRRDIERRLIRVLHNLSFIDDPTRILRAARLAARLGFVIEPRTRALIADSLEQDVPGRTTPQRIVNELRLLLDEELPERAMALLAELDVLRHLHPALIWSDQLADHFVAARAAHFPDIEISSLYLGILVYHLKPEEREALIARYRPAAPQAHLLRDITLIRERVAHIHTPGLADSLIDHTLHGIGTPGLRIAQLIEPAPIPAYIELYLSILRHIKTDINGDYLRQLGMKPGPRFGVILADLRAARLDRLVGSPEEEAAWVRQWLERG